jgi:hypothetical protein
MGFRTKKGNKVTKPSLAHLLRNPFYYGYFKWKGKIYRGIHSPIISKSQFDNVNFIMSGKGHKFRKIQLGYAFNNLLKCGICGCKILGEGKKGKYIYYHCTFSLGRHQNTQYIREEKLARIFGEIVNSISLSKIQCKWIKNVIKERKDIELIALNNRLSALSSQKSKIENRISKLLDMKFDGNIDDQTYKWKEAEYRNQLMDIDLSIKKYGNLNPNYYNDCRRILDFSNRLNTIYSRADLEDKARILRLLASKYVLDGLTISATYRKPFSYLNNLPEHIIKLPQQDDYRTFTPVVEYLKRAI